MPNKATASMGFQFIEFPSEWGEQENVMRTKFFVIWFPIY